MRFIYTIVSVLAVAYAQDASKPNAFKIPTEGTYTGLKAGGSQVFTWSNPSPGTVTITLKSGANTDLKTLKTLASNYQNTGSFTWNIPSDFVEGANYALEITSDSDKSVVNYTPQFVVSSDVKAVATSGGTTSLLTATTPAPATASSSSAPITSAASTAAIATGTGSSSRVGNGTAISTGSPSGASGSSRPSGSATGAAGAAPSTGAGASIQVASGLLAAALFLAL